MVVGLLLIPLSTLHLVPLEERREGGREGGREVSLSDFGERGRGEEGVQRGQGNPISERESLPDRCGSYYSTTADATNHDLDAPKSATGGREGGREGGRTGAGEKEDRKRVNTFSRKVNEKRGEGGEEKHNAQRDPFDET